MQIVELVNVTVLALLGLVWLGAIMFLRLRKKKSFVYLLFFTIFYIYIGKVLDYTLFQFQSLLFLKYMLPDLILNGQPGGKNVNLLPLITITLDGLRTSLLNVLLFIPLGFGLPFITQLRLKRVVITGMIVSILIELLQFVTGYLAGITFRIADINDVIFNTIGVAVGYTLFICFTHGYRRISRFGRIPANPISDYVTGRPQLDP